MRMERVEAIRQGSVQSHCPVDEVRTWGFKEDLNWGYKGEILPQTWSPPTLQDRKQRRQLWQANHWPTSLCAWFLGFPNLTCPNRTSDLKESPMHLLSPKTVEMSLTPPAHTCTHTSHPICQQIRPLLTSLIPSWLCTVITSKFLSSSTLVPLFILCKATKTIFLKLNSDPVIAPQNFQRLPIIFRRLSKTHPSLQDFPTYSSHRLAILPAPLPAMLPSRAQKES